MIEKPTPDFIWDMRNQLRKLQTTWNKFPSGKSSCSPRQYAHYNNVASIIEILNRNVEFAAEELRRD